MLYEIIFTVTRGQNILLNVFLPKKAQRAVLSIQDVSRGKVSILGRDGTSHCKKKNVHINKCLILSVYRDRAL